MSDPTKQVAHMSTGRPEAGRHYAQLYNAAQSELTALREELANTYRAACELANAMTRDVPDLSPEFELFDYTCGVIGQIDNMYAGMRSERNALQQRLAAAEQRNAVMTKALERITRPHDCGCVPCTGSCESKYALEITLDEIREIAGAALQPTESGASE